MSTLVKTDNETIAEFMGLDWKTTEFEWRIGATRPMTIGDLGYYETSWNWLMEVVLKIETLGFNVHIFRDEDGNQCMVWDNTFSYNKKPENIIIENTPVPAEFPKITAIYTTVVKFIKWYNSQKQ